MNNQPVIVSLEEYKKLENLNDELTKENTQLKANINQLYQQNMEYEAFKKRILSLEEDNKSLKELVKSLIKTM